MKSGKTRPRPLKKYVLRALKKEAAMISFKTLMRGFFLPTSNLIRTMVFVNAGFLLFFDLFRRADLKPLSPEIAGLEK